jgi:hypothetical protein
MAGALLGFLPQILLWKYFYNTFWYSPYFDVGFNFLRPQILHVLFNTQNGLFTTTPIILVALIMVIIKTTGIKRKSKIGIWDLSENWNLEIGIYFQTLIYFLLQLYLISSWNVYTQGGSYSIRMMLTTYPLLAFGMANVIGKAIKKLGSRKTLVLIFLFSALNLLSIISYLLKY